MIQSMDHNREQMYKVLVSQQVPMGGFVGRPVLESLKQRYLKLIAKAVGKFNTFYHLLKKQNKVDGPRIAV
jgi:hypothetical protein